jgi:membrane associated rhomboid family serine protease
MLNVPPVVTGTLAVMAAIHALREFVLSPLADRDLLIWLSFIPARYAAFGGQDGPLGLGPQIWTFVSYALIHGDWLHLGFNAVWFLAFGSAVARRFGTVRFLAFFAVTAAAGAAAHLVTHPGGLIPVVGASAAISGCMAAAIRFAFQGGGPLGLWRASDAHAYHVPAAPLRVALTDPRIVVFLLIWFGTNILFGIGSVPLNDGDQQVAWQAHIGGFLAGLVLFRWFDPVGSAPQWNRNATE